MGLGRGQDSCGLMLPAAGTGREPSGADVYKRKPQSDVLELFYTPYGKALCPGTSAESGRILDTHAVTLCGGK